MATTSASSTSVPRSESRIGSPTRIDSRGAERRRGIRVLELAAHVRDRRGGGQEHSRVRVPEVVYAEAGELRPSERYPDLEPQDVQQALE